jgi:hypothetical protein
LSPESTLAAREAIGLDVLSFFAIVAAPGLMRAKAVLPPVGVRAYTRESSEPNPGPPNRYRHLWRVRYIAARVLCTTCPTCPGVQVVSRPPYILTSNELRVS